MMDFQLKRISGHLDSAKYQDMLYDHTIPPRIWLCYLSILAVCLNPLLVKQVLLRKREGFYMVEVQTQI